MTLPDDLAETLIGEELFPYFRVARTLDVPYEVVLSFAERLDRFGNPLAGYRLATDSQYANGGLFQAIERAGRRENQRRQIAVRRKPKKA